MSYFTRRWEGEDKPIAKVLSALYPELAYSLLVKLLRQKDVFVNGQRQKEGSIVSRGSTLDLFCTPAMIHLKEIYADDNVLVLYKPKGVETDGDRSFAALAAFVYGSQTQVMHRLDTNTDGLVLFARNPAAYQALFAAMRDHRVIKYYRARVWGRVAEATRLVGYLQKNAEEGKVRVYDVPCEGGQRVCCDITPLAYDGRTTLLDVRLEGGKTHQLRAQLAHSGHFIVGDGKYGVDDVNRRLGYKRQQLTAYRLCFAMTEDALGIDNMVVTLPDELLTTR